MDHENELMDDDHPHHLNLRFDDLVLMNEGVEELNGISKMKAIDHVQDRLKSDDG